MPWFSFHGGHSGQFCRHAKGTLDEVLARAHAVGFSTFGLSEHAPRYRARDLFPDEADLQPADLVATFARYVEEADRQRRAWAGRMEVLVGFESEVVPEDWGPIMRQLRADARIDYVVGSVHTVGGECIDLSAERTAALAEALGGREALQRAYFDELTAMIEAFRPDVIGHLDLIRKFDGAAPAFSPTIWPHIERALEAARAAGAALDVNASPARRGMGPVYPLPAILARAHAMGVPVTLGDDSHGPADVGVGLEAALAAVAAAGYREVHYLTRAPSADGPVRWASAPLDQVAPLRRTERV